MIAKWPDRLDEIRRMVAAAKTDAEIGKVWEVTGSAIYQVRMKYGIKRPVVKRKPTPYPTRETTEPLVGTPFFDPDLQVMVMRYPARYAAGVDTQSLTVRPRRG